MIAASLETAERALGYIAPDDRETWICMGMALKAEFGDAAFGAWDTWSQAASSYDEKACKASWKSFKHGGKVGIGTLFAEAKAKGFTFTDAEAMVSPEQVARRQREREERDAKAEADRRKRAEAASKRAIHQWRTADRSGASPYCARKQISTEGVRFLAGDTIIIPMMRYDANPPALVGKQMISAAGEKKFSSGMDKSGAMYRLGEVPMDGDDIYACEGYATGGTLRMALEYGAPVFLCFDAGGLLHGLRILRALFPTSRIIVCADDDYLTGGKGAAKANEAAAEVGNALVALPAFTAPRRQSKTDESLPMLTDFNDLHVAEGLAVVREQLRAVVDAAPAAVVSGAPAVDGEPTVSPAPLLEVPAAGEANAPQATGLMSLQWVLSHCALVQGTTDVWDLLNKLRMKKAGFLATVGKETARAWEVHPQRKTISPRDLPKTVRGVAADEGARGDESIVMMLDRYTLLYPTKTVWDADKQIVAPFDAVALARGSDLAQRWLEHPHRREIDLENLVFDPTQQVDPATHINMFKGFPLTPKKDEAKAGLALALLYSLCSAEENCDEVFRWVVSWLAYPLQHPGAKMQTALLFFGEKQGTGKSLFFEGIVKPIYGEHGATGGQHQLEAQYTHWRSQKTFVLFEEILSRADKYSHFGLIKHMITGRDQPISQKYRDDRTEANHMNCVMLSNEFQAVPLEPDDRRFLVVEVGNRLDPDLHASIKAGLKDGLIEAFYAYLLEHPLRDFDPFTYPVMTSSKQRVINFGRPDWDTFYIAWSAGDLAVPFCSCLSEDLYEAYEKYCSKFGGRSLPLVKFAELIAQRLKKDRQWVGIGSAKRRLRTVFHVPVDSPDGQAKTLEKQCEEFHTALTVP